MKPMSGPASLEVAGRRVTITHPDKVVFPAHAGSGPYTKLDLLRYYLAVADGALRGVAGRPMILKRFVKGISEEAVFQKRAPAKRPDWVDVAELRYASGTFAAEAVIHDAAGLAWAINLGCVDLNPHPVLAGDLDHPDELRVDLDPMPGVTWRRIVDVALVAREVLEDYGLVAWPKTSGSRGFHIYARIAPRWRFRPGPTGCPDRRAGGRATHPGCGDQPLVEGRTRGGVRRLQPERQRPHGRLGLFGAGYSRRAGVHAAALGRGRRLRARGLHHGHRARAGSPKSVTRGRGWIQQAVGELDRLLMLAEELGPPEKAPKGSGKRADGRRVSSKPLIEIARTKTKDEAMAALDTWRDRYPAVAGRLQPSDVLVDGMRGPSSIWYRIRINLQHVPVDQRPPQEELIADYSPWRGA